jgi:hypothetical protein
MLKALVFAAIAMLLPCEEAAMQADRKNEAATVRKEIQEAPVWDFGKVRRDQEVEHSFELHNDGAEPLEIKTVQLTPPLAVTAMKRVVQPGETSRVSVRLGQPRNGGDFEGLIVVQFAKEGSRPKLFRVQGRIVKAIDFEPLQAFFITASTGESAEQSIEIVNYDTEPLHKMEVARESTRFRTSLQELEPGRRYKLTVRTLESNPIGKYRDAIELKTSNAQYPSIKIPVNTQVRARVYTFPDSLTFGLIDRNSVRARPEELPFLTQSLMIYQRNGSNFEITPETNIPFLHLTKRKGEKKDRYEIVAEVVPDKLTAGRFEGVIKITTNDPDFPVIEVPVLAQVK